MSDGAGWVQISTAGFAAPSQFRPPEHLVKELVQNSLDAVQDTGGSVEFYCRNVDLNFLVECNDAGKGIENLAAIRDISSAYLSRTACGRY